jgi:uncharacterized protein with LGFP repeats
VTPLEEEITKLSRMWYYFVGVDHHKDRDCHWYVEQYFSYGEAPYFKAWHHGYIASDFEGSKCSTLEEAQEELRDRLALEIHKAKEWVTRNLNEIIEIKKTDSDEMYFGDEDEYRRMLDFLNGAEWKPRD